MRIFPHGSLEPFRIHVVVLKDSVMRAISALTRSGVTSVNTWRDD